jgi:uncharacterized ferredoxin-like protein
MRLLAPATGAVGIKTDRHEYRGRIIEVSDRQDIKELRAVGYTVGDVGGRPSRAAGFECHSCGFQSFFRLCSRCGDECDRPDLVA